MAQENPQFLKSIAGQLRLLGGKVYLEQNNLAEMKAGELAKKMSVVFTEKLRAEMKSCRDVVATGRYPYTGWFGVLSRRMSVLLMKSWNLRILQIFVDRNLKGSATGKGKG